MSEADWRPFGLTVETALNRGDDARLLFDENSPIRDELRRLLAAAPSTTQEEAMSAEQPAQAEPAAPDLKRIAWLIGTIFHHGEFVAETCNERELESVLKRAGYWFNSTDEAVAAEYAAPAQPAPTQIEADRAQRAVPTGSLGCRARINHHAGEEAMSTMKAQAPSLRAAADSRLIDELLTALKRALDAGIGGDGRQPSPSEQARAAIAKATGAQA